jgi:phospholipid-translocating ATPase
MTGLSDLETAHQRIGSNPTGMQLATRGRRDMSSRVRDVVLSLALCHNVRYVAVLQNTSDLEANRSLLLRTTMAR